jgi:glutamate synthase domain-containing protein 1
MRIDTKMIGHAKTESLNSAIRKPESSPFGSEKGRLYRKEYLADRDYRIPGNCAVSGIMNEAGKCFSGDAIIRSIALMHDRANGMGGGFAAYGIYPDMAKYYAFHMMYDEEDAKQNAEHYIRRYYTIIHDSPIRFKKTQKIGDNPLLWKYFLEPKKEVMHSQVLLSEEDMIAQTVTYVNSQIRNAFVVSSGKNMGIFKGVGYPEDIAEFYRLDQYKGYLWTSHGRFPTNSVAWWGGAHPFGFLDWSVVHNGEISSYGINRRYLENFGYQCAFFTDTEVIIYLFDLLSRMHGIPFEIIAKILSAPFWNDIERMPEDEKRVYESIRMVYASALINGPFAVIAANSDTMFGLNDRVKLRPLVAARHGDFVYIASEESAIREVCPRPDSVWMPRAGEPVIGRLKKEPLSEVPIGSHMKKEYEVM